MTETGKELAFNVIKSIVADGSTNIWHCLQTLNAVASKPEFAGCNIVTAMLTDGLPNIRPPSNDEAAAYKSLIRNGNLSTFGFGYDLDSKLLSAIANVGGGSNGFAPDYSIVGTVFINWCATMLATASKDRMFMVKYEDGTSSQHATGLVQYGQPRNITLQVSKKPVSVLMDGAEFAVVSGLHTDYVKARHDLLQSLAHCIGHDGDTTSYTGLYAKWSGSTDSKANELVRDVKPVGEDDEGQIIMAPRYWAKWGKHYSRSYKRAVELEQCMNFKDPGLQIFGGTLFKELQKQGDSVFCNLPPIEPTGRLNATAVPTPVAPASVNMGSVFMNQSGGCWAPGSKVLMADGSHVAIEKLVRGSKVWTPSGSATVTYTLALGTKKISQAMCNYEGLWITPWHPVLRNATWVFPSSYTTIVDRIMPFVYNMILSSDHIIKVDGVLTVTLGHGFKNGIVAHDFFGSRKAVLMAIEGLPGFDSGHVVFDDLRTTKNPITGAITGWYNGARNGH